MVPRFWYLPTPYGGAHAQTIEADGRGTYWAMHDFLSGRLLNVLPPVLAGAILLATVWFHLRPAAIPPASPPAKVANSFPAPAASANLSEIAGWALFGAAVSSVVAAPEPAESLEDLPPSSIDLKLNGIAYSLDNSRAFAIVGTPDGQQRDYRAGDSLSEGVIVHAIRPLEVVISNQGKLESIALPLESATASGLPSGAEYPIPGLPPIQASPSGAYQVPIQEPIQEASQESGPTSMPEPMPDPMPDQ